MTRRPAPHLLPAATIALFLFSAVQWSLLVPPFESPDETGHARYVNFLREAGRLPAASEAAGEAHQPPLYYIVAAGVSEAAGWEPIPVKPERNPAFVWYGGSDHGKYIHSPSERPPLSGTASTLHRTRLLSVILSCGTVAFVLLTARAAGFSDRAATVVAGMAAFTPQFTFISASLNNDALANLAGAACLAGLAAAVTGPSGVALWAAAGAAAGIGIAAKLTTTTLLACGAIAVWLARARPGSSTRARAAAFGLPAAVLGLPVLLGNVLRWGDPFATGAQASALPQLVDRKTILSGYFLTEFPRVLFGSFWGRFGWMSFPLPAWLILAFAALSAAGLAGLVLAARRRRPGEVWILLAAAVAMQIAQVGVYNLSFTQAQGRFLFPVIGPAMILLAAGLGELVPRGRRAAPPPALAAALVVAMALGNLAILRFWVAPAYFGGA